jgi:hypothetical protein
MLVLTASLPCLAGTGAHADPTDLVTRSLVLERNQIEAALTVEVALTERSMGTPIAIAPDVWFGATNEITVGVIHSSPSVDRIDARSTLCLRQSDATCDGTYQGSGVDVRYRASDRVVPRMRFLLRDTDPWKPATTVGALTRWSRGRFSITADPYFRFGLANTEKGNRAAFSLPVWLGVQPTCRWLVELHTGAEGDFAVIRDGWHMPFALKVTARATAQLDIVVEGGFSQLYGPQIDIRQRTLMITVAWRSDGADGVPRSDGGLR